MGIAFTLPTPGNALHADPRKRGPMPATPIITPEPAPSVARTTLGITGTRGAAAPSWGCTYHFCSAAEDE